MSNNTLRYPLKQEILLITDSGFYIGTIIFAGKNSLTVINLRKRIYSDNGQDFNEIEITSKAVFDRSKVLGYSKLEQEQELEDIYEKCQLKTDNNVIKLHRDNKHD